MSTVRELHEEASRLAQLAMLARDSAQWSTAEDLARRALGLELRAVALVPDDEASEPTRSILYLGAASLAYQSKDFAAALRLAAKGLSGHPPRSVEQDLRNLYERVGFEYDLKTQGLALDEDELQLLLRGSSVGSGTVLYNDFRRRIDATLKLIRRTVQRKMGRTFQRRGRLAGMYQTFAPVLSLSEGSFVVNLKLVRPEDDQMSLLCEVPVVLDEVLAGIELVEAADHQGLEELIEDKLYRDNFVVLAREVAPDGDRVSFVGFSSRRGSVSLTRPRAEITLAPEVETEGDEHGEPVTLQGELDYARARGRDQIGLTTDTGEHFTLDVRESMDDVVRSYFGQLVRVRGVRMADRIHLVDIEGVGE